MGLEALSRGISSATFVESGREALSVLRDNVSALGAEKRATILGSDVFSLAGRTISDAPFSLILLDPPYTLDAAKTSGLLTDLRTSDQVVPGALVVWEHLAGQMPPWPLGYVRVARKRYGSTEVDIGVCEGGSEPA
jgi:16S rRNA (guanine966-N2)-methyltransferase